PFKAPSTCINDTSVAVMAGLPKFILPTHVGNQTVYLSYQGDQCTMKGNYPLGYLPVLALAQGYMFPVPPIYMPNTAQCGLMLASIFDKALKSNFTINDINNRTIFTSSFNLTKFINSIDYPGFSGKRTYVDSGGDIISDQSILIYKPDQITPTIKGISAIPVGNWSVDSDQVNFYDFGDSTALVFLGNKTSPPPPRQIPIIKFSANVTTRYVFDGIVGICSMFTLALWIYMLVNKDLKIFKASSPKFLTVKSKSKSINVAKHLNDTVLFGVLIVFLGLWAVLLVIWTVIPSQRPKLVVDSVASVAKNGTILSFTETPHCEFGGYNYVCLAAMVITLAFGVMLTYSVRNTPSAFNESKWIAMALYNWVVIGIVLNAITNFVLRDPDVIFVMEALNAIITQTGVAGFLFIPKMLEIRSGHGNDTASTFQSTTTSNSSGPPSLISSQLSNRAGGEIGMLQQTISTLQDQLNQAHVDKSKIEKEFAEYREKFGKGRDSTTKGRDSTTRGRDSSC
ncbi:hypothetical protein HDU76_001436, partial [Blyttiomyces sp. JEL0837]